MFTLWIHEHEFAGTLSLKVSQDKMSFLISVILTADVFEIHSKNSRILNSNFQKAKEFLFLISEVGRYNFECFSSVISFKVLGKVGFSSSGYLIVFISLCLDWSYTMCVNFWLFHISLSSKKLKMEIVSWSEIRRD